MVRLSITWPTTWLSSRKVRELDPGSLCHKLVLVDEPAQSVTSMDSRETAGVGLVGIAEGGW